MARRVSRIGRPLYARPSRPRQRPGFLPRPVKPKRGWWKLLVAAGVIIGLWRYFAIEKIEIRQLEGLKPAALEKAVRSGMKDQLLGENLATLNGGRLERSVIEQIPEVKTLRVERKWPTVLVVIVTEREPSLGWQSGGELYLLDRDGTVIRQISARGARVAIVTDTTNLPVKIGERIVPERFVGFTVDAVGKLSGVGGGIKRLSVSETTSELYAQMGGGYLVRLDTNRGAAEQIKSLKLVLQDLAKKGRRPVEYVDLRVEGKVYYK